MNKKVNEVVGKENAGSFADRVQDHASAKAIPLLSFEEEAQAKSATFLATRLALGFYVGQEVLVTGMTSNKAAVLNGFCGRVKELLDGQRVATSFTHMQGSWSIAAANCMGSMLAFHSPHFDSGLPPPSYSASEIAGFDFEMEKSSILFAKGFTSG